jgi:hypothetical protein
MARTYAIFAKPRTGPKPRRGQQVPACPNRLSDFSACLISRPAVGSDFPMGPDWPEIGVGK